MTATSTLGVTTTNAIREALGAASRGMLTEACAIATRALNDGGDMVALNALLGMLMCRAGNLDAGIVHLRIAHEARPGDVKIAGNLVTALISESRHREAIELLGDELVDADRTMQLARLHGFLAQTLEEFEAAIRSYEKVVVAVPSDWEAWNNLGNARRCVGDFEGSVKALEKAAEAQPDSPPIRLNLALAIGAAGNLQESEAQLRRLADGSPLDTQALRELFALYIEQMRDDEALQAIEEAVRRDPEDLDLRLALAGHLSQTHHYDAAEKAYLAVIEKQPSHGQANLGLAFVYELTNQTDALVALMQEAEEREVEVAEREFIRAFGFRRQKRYEEGLKSLDQVPDSLESPRRFHLLGQMLQGAGRYDEAFAAFQRMNAMTIDEPVQPEQRGAGYRQLIRRQYESLTDELVSRWEVDRALTASASPAFLVGFPRSGTTLLDTMLMGHSDIKVLEEEPAMREAGKLLPEVAGLPDVASQQVETARNRYWQVAKSLVPIEQGTLLVDKNPLTMNDLPQVHCLFPDAKIILALRHPCDVVLSCYITNFRANDGMASFLKLDTAAELYDLSFSYLKRVQEVLKLPMHTVVYERIVAQRERELRALLEFLGLDWDERVMQHEETAKGRGRIKTASYSQVVEPIYSRASGRWWNYRKHLEPIFPVLAPWVERFGYSLDDPEKFPVVANGS